MASTIVARQFRAKTESLPWRHPSLAGRIPEIDGLRAIAVSLVLIWHCVVCAMRPAVHSWGYYALLPLQITWSGVDLFFVISGFLVGGILIDCKESPRYYRAFYGRRTFRIFPVYFVWLALFAAGRALLGASLPGTFSGVIPDWSYPLFLQNLFMAAAGSYGAEWLNPTWSLAVEEQFYIVMSVIVRRLSMRTLTKVLIAMVCCAPVLRVAFVLAGAAHYPMYVLLPCRMDALGIGVLLAIALRNETAWRWISSHRWAIYSAFACACLVLASCYRYPGKAMPMFGYSAFAVFYGCIVLFAVCRWVPAKILRTRPLYQLSLISYAVYVTHAGIIRLVFGFALNSEPIVSDARSALVMLSAFGITVAVAAASWVLMEKRLIGFAGLAFRY